MDKVQYETIRVGRDKRGLFVQGKPVGSFGRVVGTEEQLHTHLAELGYKRVSNEGHDHICGEYVRAVSRGA